MPNTLNRSGQSRVAGRFFPASVLFVLVALCPPAPAQTLQARIDSALAARHSLQSATIGIHIRDAGTGDELYAARADRALIPASNMKLLTTGAALRILGPDAVFETRLGWDGGRVVIIGDGDPGLGDPALLDRTDPPMTVDAMLDQLAAALATAAPSRVSEIVVDDRVFERRRVHPTWPVDQLNKWYCAEVAGLNFHTNVLTFYLSAGEGGSDRWAPGLTPAVRLQPAIDGVGLWIGIDNKARTIQSGPHTAWVARAAGARPANEYTVFGDVRMGSVAAVDAAIHEPPVVFGSLLAERLTGLGVAVPRDSVGRPRVRLASENERFDAFETAAVVRTGMPDIMRRANTNSQNLYTEALLKRIGHHVTKEPGSWSNGSAVVRMLLADDLGPEHANRTRIEDGSGMSRGNQVAPATITAWLSDIIARPAIARAFLDSMPEPGEGTLRRRFRGGSTSGTILGKTGSINGVRCFSGFVFSPGNEHAVAFSILVNDIQHGSQIRDALELHEEIALEIDRWLAAQPRAVERVEALETDAIGG